MPIDAALLQAMTDRVRHCGPDAKGALVAAGIGLGSQQLSIIDLETEDQPIANEDNSIVVCNGEIYNYVELRLDLSAAGHKFRTQSDTEVLVHLYEDCGTGCVERLRGMFALALPHALRMKRLPEQHILREAVVDLLPREIAQREKRGLRAPIRAWLRGPLPEFAAELLSGRSLRRRGYFDPPSV